MVCINMAATSFLVSSLIMGALVVAIGFGVVRGRKWRARTQVGTEHDELWLFRAGDWLSGAIRKPWAWGIAFVALIAVFGGGTLMLLSGQSWALLAMGAAAGLVVSVYLFYGAYASIRMRGLGNAAAAAAGSWAVGSLFLLVLVVKLLAG